MRMRKLMKLYKLNFKSITAIISVTSAILIFSLLSNLTYADGFDTDLNKMCDRQSILIAAKLRSNSTTELTAQDVSMIRLGAINGCLETYKRIVNSSKPINATSPDKKVAKKTEVNETQESKNDEKESIFDRLLSTEKKEDVSPMQKKHRTGGK